MFKKFNAESNIINKLNIQDAMEKENPFSPAYPANPKYFVDRTEVLNSFEKAFGRSIKTERPTPDNIAILGDWGIGKSSVLRKFEAMALENKERRVFSATVRLIPSFCTSFDSFTANVINDIERNFTVHAPLLAKVREEVKNWRIKINLPGIGMERIPRRISGANIFGDALLNLWKVLEKSGVDTVLLMIDDIHYLAEKYPDGLYDLRGIFQGLPEHGCNFMLCVTGKREVFTNIRELAEPLTRFFNLKHTLDVFNLEETRDAILKPIRIAGLNLTVDDDVIKRIYHLTAGHPFFIHFIMREAASLRPEGNITIEWFKRYYTEIQRIMAREKFDADFSIASDKEKKILLFASALPDNFPPSDINIKGVRLQLKFLLKKNLVIKHERGEYSLYHPLFREYLRAKLGK